MPSDSLGKSSRPSSIAAETTLEPVRVFLRARTMEPINLIREAIQNAQDVGDPVGMCCNVLMLAIMHIYWLPRYAVAERLLERLLQQAGYLVSQLASSAVPSQLIQNCRARATYLLQQLQAHHRAELTTPFFVGEYVQLPLQCGTVDAIYMTVDFRVDPIYICQHPLHGRNWLLQFNLFCLGFVVVVVLVVVDVVDVTVW
jgi:hypothetical protein